LTKRGMYVTRSVHPTLFDLTFYCSAVHVLQPLIV